MFRLWCNCFTKVLIYPVVPDKLTLNLYNNLFTTWLGHILCDSGFEEKFEKEAWLCLLWLFDLDSSAPPSLSVLSQPVSSACELWRLRRRMRGDSAASPDSASLTLSSAGFDQSCTRPAPSARSAALIVNRGTEFPLRLSKGRKKKSGQINIL